MGIMDIVIIAIVALCAVFGFFKGFFKSMVSFFSFAVSVALSILLTKYVAKALLSMDSLGKIVAGDEGSIFAFIKGFLPKAYKAEGSYDEIRLAYFLGGKGAVEEAFTSGGFFSGFFSKKIIYPVIKNALTNPVYLASNVSTVADVVALEIAYGIFCAGVGVLLFFAVRIIAAIFAMLLTHNTDNRKSFLGRFVGLFIGGMKGVVNAFVLLCILSLVTNFSFMAKPNEEIEKSKFAKDIMGVSVKAISLVLDAKEDDSRYETLLKHAGFSVFANLE